MEPNRTFPFRTIAIALLLAPALPAQRQELDPENLTFPYADFEVHRGLDRAGLEELENTPDHNPVTDRGAALGRVLFYDKRLSLNEQTACASCHLQENAFADPREKSRGFRGRRTIRNSMSLANLAYYENGKFFWDERGSTLEEMVLMPIQDEIEMGMNLTELVERLEADAGYRWLFWNAYGDPAVTTDRIAYSLAQFLRSMVSLNSKFDEGLALTRSVVKDFDNFTDQENHGKRVFLQACASCHIRNDEPRRGAMPARNRPLPILLQGTEPTNNGIDSGRARDDDSGCGAITNDVADVGKFKAPSLRNVALTAPYMHDGRFSNLRRVIEHYSHGILPHRNLDPRLSAGTSGGSWGGGPRTPRAVTAATPGPATPPHTGVSPTPPMKPTRPRTTASQPLRDSVQRPVGTGFQFTHKEKEALLAFLKTLTDESFVSDPKFSNPFDTL